MASIHPQTIKHAQELLKDFHGPDLIDNPYAWVIYAFPWGQKNTPLENRSGPHDWQREELLAIWQFIKDNKALIARGQDSKTYKCAISSGRGPGKSAFMSWVALWNISCNIGSSTIVTANTDTQLTHKTFAEISKWSTMAVNAYWFDRTQKSVTIAGWLAEAFKKQLKLDSKYWYINGELWNEDTPDSFAGAHNDHGEMYLFDEASGIPQSIWEVTEGIFTEQTPYKIWICTSNPRNNSGPFYNCFHEHRAYWRTRKIDARTVAGLPQEAFKEIIAKHGEDSRQARVDITGEFPEQGDRQFISRSAVAAACGRQLERYDDFAPLRLGVDPARFGDDSTVLRFRQGRDARSIPAIVMKGADNMQVANKIAELVEKYNPDGIFIDSGAGAGIIDRCREMGIQVFEVQFGSKAEDSQWYDHRTELWARMRDWINGAMLPLPSRDEDKKLIEDLVAPEFEVMGREEKMKLESKEKMKKRHYPSPDNADALAVTFHCEITRKDRNVSKSSFVPKERRAQGIGGGVVFSGEERSSGGRARVASGVGCDIKWDKD